MAPYTAKVTTMSMSISMDKSATPPQPAERAQPPAQPAAQPLMGPQAELSTSEVLDIVAKANDAMKSSQSNVLFTVDPDSGERVVKVVDKETQEVLRQIPTVEMLKIAKAIEKMQGVLVSTQA